MTGKTRKRSRQGKSAKPRKVGSAAKSGLPAALRARLGIAAGKRLRKIVVEVPARKGRHEGRTLDAPPSGATVEFFIGRLAMPEPALEPARIDSEQARRWIKVYRDPYDPRSFSVDVEPGRKVHIFGAASRSPGTGRGEHYDLREGGYIRLNGKHPDLVIGVPEGTIDVEVWEADQDLPTFAAVLDAAITDFDAAPWLAESARSIATAGGPMAAAASLGLVARLWANRSPAARARLESGDSPAKRARDWWKEVPSSTRKAAVTAAIGEAGTLADDLESLPTLAISNPRIARSVAMRWVERRDDLTSVAFLAGREARALLRTLEALDRQVAIHIPVLADVLRGTPSSDRLAAVRWMEPDAWWGQPW